MILLIYNNDLIQLLPIVNNVQILSMIYSITMHITVEVKTMATIMPTTSVFDNFLSWWPANSEHDNSGGLHSLALPKKELSVNPENVEGSWPWRWLFDRFNPWRLVSFPSEGGTSPWSLLLERFNLFNFKRLPRDDGISTEKRVVLKIQDHLKFSQSP